MSDVQKLINAAIYCLSNCSSDQRRNDHNVAWCLDAVRHVQLAQKVLA